MITPDASYIITGNTYTAWLQRDKAVYNSCPGIMKWSYISPCSFFICPHCAQIRNTPGPCKFIYEPFFHLLN